MALRTTFNQLNSFKYVKWDEKFRTEKPFHLYVDLPDDTPNSVRGNIEFESAEPEVVHDIRGRESDFKLDIHGFEFHQYQRSEFSEWENVAAVKSKFYPEMRQLMKQHVLDADFVHVFQHRVGELS